jgi:tRNA(Ile)-lysidine synthase
MMGHLSDLGLTRDRLVRTAGHMARARRTLRMAARDFAEAHVRGDRGDLLLARQVLDLDRGDSPGRVLAAALRWLGGKPDKRRPRYEDLKRLAGALLAGRTATLAGCLVTPEADGARVTREWRAVRGLRRPLTFDHHLDEWDSRWRLFAPPGAAGPLHVAALGVEGLVSCPNWRDTGMPRASLLASPAVWDGERLVAAPVAAFANGWAAEPTGDFPDEVEFG